MKNDIQEWIRAYPIEAIICLVILCMLTGFGLGRMGWEAWDREALLFQADDCSTGIAKRNKEMNDLRLQVLTMIERKSALQDKKGNAESIADYRNMIEKGLKDIERLKIEIEQLRGTREAFLWIVDHPNLFRMEEVDRGRYEQIRRQLIQAYQRHGAEALKE